MKSFVIFAALVAFATAAWGADCVVERAASAPALVEAPSTDDSMELYWDSGTSRWWLIWYTGADTWVGNDFDISTLSAYSAIEAIKLQARYEWPNGVWDGFRLGIFSFSGGVPGSLLWGPTYVLPSGPTGWKEFSVGWTLPGGVTKFVAAQEQFYNWPPSGDPFAIDNNPTCMWHSWQYFSGAWSPFEQANIAPYRNVMIRVIVSNSTLGVAPASVGRVKALYY